MRNLYGHLPSYRHNHEGGGVPSHLREHPLSGRDRRSPADGPAIVSRSQWETACYFTYATWTRSMVPLNLNGALS